jgi:transposase
MRVMRPPGTPEQLEARRRRAIELLDAGESLSSVARAVNASVSSVYRWRQAYQAEGLKGLLPKPTPGRPPKLSATQRERLRKLLQGGPPAAGYETELWTLRRVAELIESEFRVSYHPCHVWRVLKKMGWSCQKPERRARERDEDAIERWRLRRWPHIKKRPAGGP